MMSEANQALVDALVKFQRWCEAGGPDLTSQLAAATAARDEAVNERDALATGIAAIHSGRIVLSQADNGEWGAVLGVRIVTGCGTAGEAVLAALQPKETDGGK